MAPCDPKPALGFYGRPRSGVLPPDLPGDESDGGCGYGHASRAQSKARHHKKSDPGLGLRQIEDVAEVGWLQLRLTSVVDY